MSPYGGYSGEASGGPYSQGNVRRPRHNAQRAPQNPYASQAGNFRAPQAPNPFATPGNVPFSGPMTSTRTQAPGNTPFSGPSNLGYGGQRIAPSQRVQGLADVGRINAPGMRQASSPLAYGGPMAATYRGQRVNPHGMVQAQQDVRGIGAGQQGMYGINPNERVQGGQYFQGPAAGVGLPGLQQFANDANRLEGATFQRALNRLSPQFDEQRQATEQRLADQGIPIGSEAYQAEMDRLDRSQNDARENLALSSVGAGRQEHSRITDLARTLQGQGFGQDLASRQFGAGEQGRRFQEGLAGNQADFGQRLASTQLAAQESARRFNELSRSQAQQHGLNQVNRQFTANERGRDFGERLASENQFFNQQLAGDQFAAAQNQYAHGSGVQQRQFSDNFGAQQQQQNFQNQLASQGQQHGLNLANRQFQLASGAQDFGQRMGSESQFFNQGLARDQFAAQQGLARDQMQIGQNQFNANFNQRGNQFADQFAAQQGLNRDQMQIGQNQWGAQFGANQQQQQFNNQLAGAGFNWGVDQGLWNRGFQDRQLDLQRYGIDRQAQNDQSRNRGNLFGTLGQLGLGALSFFSDERLKTDIKKVGEMPGGMPVHSWRYKGDSKRYVSPTAQNVEKWEPSAVSDGPGGYKVVDMAKVLGQMSEATA